MKIAAIRATTVTVPLEAPLRHSNGAHWGRFVRTIVEVEADNGLIGLGELGGGGQSAEAAVTGLTDYLVGHDPADTEALRFMIANPTASLYNNRTQLLAAIEFACLDLVGQQAGLPVHALLGGKVREEVEFASYLFYRYPGPDGTGEVRTNEQLVAEAQRLREDHGFRVHKLKGGVFDTDHELAGYQALAEAMGPADKLRYDPNGALSVGESIRFAKAIEDLPNDYLEDPVYSLPGMRQVRENTHILLATNTVVVNTEQLATTILNPAVDVVLLDTTFWGGIRPCLKAAAICEAFSLGVAVHSSGELGIQLATMLHLGAAVPNLTYAADAHYHHLLDDVVQGGKRPYVNGKMTVPTEPGLGVKLDRDKVAEYAELYRELGDYPYDRDPGRPGWYPLLPNTSFADPREDRLPEALAAEYARR
ncbi:mandelate racemase [Ruania alkalisoli]|uniref:glucarate dehydratase n=1 Tax=Ruania alkalisoli TaxID=2779775 RepID=A0A7M1SSV4_9MICO|nr:MULTISPECIES: enolase C-terminal domain-like protein [Ruania]QOR69693.1 mandelate racemase [Ruania alkalisoli]